MDDRLLIVRSRPLLDLISLGRDAADLLRDRDPSDPLASALHGAAAEVAGDLHEPARLVNIDTPRTSTLTG